MFVVFCTWAYRPGARGNYEDAGRIPFRAPEEE
ncbi:cbb3-type cytochrome c oxidase subunit 3 [Oleomonas cavernae]|uniref:Cbb3-type cytochrome c oxidase subunit 3 n=2 Tax=Oleomonas cavernae TaxID=2320859 RepID=A0A418WJ94_9PROT|nr:cbb3-type cytochrome c oxidase subunit 3 [Oleomonas cavernae]